MLNEEPGNAGSSYSDYLHFVFFSYAFGCDIRDWVHLMLVFEGLENDWLFVVVVLFAAFLRRKWDSVRAHSEWEDTCIHGKALGCNYRVLNELCLRL